MQKPEQPAHKEATAYFYAIADHLGIDLIKPPLIEWDCIAGPVEINAKNIRNAWDEEDAEAAT